MAYNGGMSPTGSNPDPYTESGAHASVQQTRRKRREALVAALCDADALQARGHAVLRRGARHSVYAGVGFVVSTAFAFLFGTVAWRSFDGTYDGALVSNWSMLGVIVAAGGMHMAMGWLVSRKRLRETGARLIRRAEYQRKLTALQLTEAEHEAIR